MEVWFLRRWKEMGYRAQREELASTGRDIPLPLLGKGMSPGCVQIELSV